MVLKVEDSTIFLENCPRTWAAGDWARRAKGRDTLG